MQNFFRYFFIIFIINFHVHGNDSLYLVKDNQIFIQNEDNISDLREKAKNIAFENAFGILVKKIAEPRDFSKLNFLEDIKINSLVTDYNITNEIISDISYSANIAVNFNPGLILEFFSNNNIRVQTLVSDQYLVLPVMKKFNTLYLWEANNLWYENLRIEYDDVSLLKLYFPEKNHLNKLRISANKIINKDIESLKKFLKFHSKKNAIIVILEENFDNKIKKFKSRVELITYTNDKFEIIKFPQDERFNQISSTSQIKLIAKITINELQNWWKNKIDSLDSLSSSISTFFIQYNFNDIKRSVFIENVLLQVFNEEDLTFNEIKGNSVSFKVNSSFSEDKINLALEKYGLKISLVEKNIFLIKETN